MSAKSVTIFSTMRGVVNRVGQKLYIQTTFGNYPISGADLEIYLGNQVEITGHLRENDHACPFLQVDSCTNLPIVT